MHSYGHRGKWLLAWVLAGVAAAAQAVEFDEKVKAPAAAEPAAFASRAEAFRSRLDALGTGAPRALIEDRALLKEQVDLLWQFQRALDNGRPPDDLAALGIEPRGDGSYVIDYNVHPEWKRLDQSMASLLPVVEWNLLSKELQARGFRDSDLATLQKYVAENDARRLATRRALPLAISFSKVVRKLDRLRRPVPDSLVLSYLYQRERVDAEATREWTQGLLQTLDAQRARILVSYFEEMESTGVISADNQRAGIDELLRLMRLPDFEQLATAEAQGITP
jgi:hypothetical protein